MTPQSARKRLGIIGGLGALGSADIFFNLIQASTASGQPPFDLIFEQHPFDEGAAPGASDASMTGRKLYVFDTIKSFETRHVDAVLLPCFLSHTFIDELRAELKLPIISMLDALRMHLERQHPKVRKIGVLTSDYVQQQRLFEHSFPPPYSLVFPKTAIQRECLMPAIYGPSGIKSGNLQGASIDLLERAGRDVLEQGAEIIVPGFTEVSMVAEQLRERGIPILDSNQIYARFAVAHEETDSAKAFKIGIVGGVGPAATVDFVNKIVRNTKARRDQDHIKLVVEQNPQIPDRTEHLTGAGPDPTVALYATCKKLEASHADLIAIPCNTAHAYVERIQPYLSILIVNMPVTTVEYIRQQHGQCQKIGLLATTGTLQSRVYHAVLEQAGLSVLEPDAAHQESVMRSIYGDQGVKAGYTEGVCREDLLNALKHLVAHGAEVVLLGCTELPLLLAQNEAYEVGGKRIVILDPAEILARKCVELAQQAPR